MPSTLPRPRLWAVLVLVTGAAIALVGSPAARAAPAGAPAAGAGQWPVRPVSVSADFRPPARDWLRGHRGLDLRATVGQPVRAAAAGVVAFAGVIAGRGVLVIRHGSLRSTYEPVAATVGAGTPVVTGQVIGHLAEGTGHCGATPSCLHWGLRRGPAYVDPRVLLAPVRPVLRPPRSG